MDWAIILSSDLKKINIANALLSPDTKIKTSETGTRHKAAERTAKQISGIVIAVSERKKEITLYYKNMKYPLYDTSHILRKANEHIHILERQKELFDMYLSNLDKHEIRGYTNLNNAVKVIQKGKVIQKISNELKKALIELGTEGHLLKTRLKEILLDVDKETDLVITDYSLIGNKKADLILDNLSYEELLDKEKIISILGYEGHLNLIPIKGWRMLSKTSLTEAEIALLIRTFGSLKDIFYKEDSEFITLIGEEKAKALKNEIERIRMNL